MADYLKRRQSCGDDGKSLLIGFQGGMAVFAVAAALRGARDHPRFLTFARYLIHQRFECDGFALMLPAFLGDVAVYLAEWRLFDDVSVVVIRSDGNLGQSDLGAGLIGDLGVRGARLPGLMRRDLDQLYETLKVPLPERLSVPLPAKA